MSETPKKLVVKVHATNPFGTGPMAAVIELTPEFIARVHGLQTAAVALNVALISEDRAPHWDIDNDFRIEGEMLVVGRRDFWFTGRPDHYDYRVETEAVLISQLDEYLASSDPVIYHGDYPDDLAETAQMERLLSDGVTV